jgi:Plasmid pRiA4b ORF-3-like protein
MPSNKRSHNGKQVSHRPNQTVPKGNGTDKSNLLFQFKITLHESKPLIWRRIQVPDCTLAVLHDVIQAAMGWENCHLHRFIIDGVQYGVPEPELKLKNEDEVMLSQIVPKGGKGFRSRYEYDFGDGWMHDVVFEGYSPNDVGQKFPVCLDGSRACPPDDCGGPYGYAEFLEAIADPKHDRHAELLDWIGGKFDPEHFDVKSATMEMMEAVRRSL